MGGAPPPEQSALQVTIQAIQGAEQRVVDLNRGPATVQQAAWRSLATNSVPSDSLSLGQHPPAISLSRLSKISLPQLVIAINTQRVSA